jgi:hypothetical protein
MIPSVVKYNDHILVFSFNDPADPYELYINVYKSQDGIICGHISRFGFTSFDISQAILYTGKNSESMNLIIRSFMDEIDTSAHLRQLIFEE